MDGKHYKMRILPLFEDDLNDAIDYIAYTLENPQAAEKLVSDVEEALQKRLPFAESFEQFPSKRERKHPYYHIYVGNFTVFYVVIGDVMEVRRILYGRRNTKSIL